MNRPLLRVAGATLAALVPSASTALAVSDHVTRLVSSDPEVRRLGESTALLGDTLIAGAPYGEDSSGRAVVFSRAGGAWLEEQVLSPAGNNVYFGRSVALAPGVALIGGLRDFGEPRAFVFELNGSLWTEVAVLSSDATRYDSFGASVACSAERLVIGAPRTPAVQSRGPGKAYVYVRGAGGWVLEAEILGDDLDQDAFGKAVALDGERILVGAPGFTFQPGAAFVFTRNGSTWTREARLTPAASDFYDDFGLAVSLDGERAAISGVGAYIFVRSGTQWSEEATLASLYTRSISLSGVRNTIGDEGGFNGAGSARIDISSGPAWSPQAGLFHPDLLLGSSFAVSLSMDGERVAVGASRDGDDDQGAVYLFERPVGTAHCTASLNSTGEPARIVAQGTPSVQADDLHLRASPVPDTPGLFFAGTIAIQAPFGPGYRCVGGAISRLRPTVGSGGELELRLDLAQGSFVPGSSWHFQAWFRDSQGGSDSFGTSDGVSVTFAP